MTSPGPVSIPVSTTASDWISIPSSTGGVVTLFVLKTTNVPVGHSFSVGAGGVTEFCHDPECPEARCILRKVMES